MSGGKLSVMSVAGYACLVRFCTVYFMYSLFLNIIQTRSRYCDDVALQNDQMDARF
jgi:hypothetical protein